jgi:hypothetical protein
MNDTEKGCDRAELDALYRNPRSGFPYGGRQVVAGERFRPLRRPERQHNPVRLSRNQFLITRIRENRPKSLHNARGAR